MEVFPTTARVEVYATEDHTVMIKQEDPYGGDDSFVEIPYAHIEAMVKALREAKKVLSEGIQG